MSDFTADEIIARLVELEELRRRNADLSRMLKDERKRIHALESATTAWNVMVVMGPVVYISKDSTLIEQAYQQYEIGYIEGVVRGDVVMAVGRFQYVRTDDIEGRVYLIPYFTQIIHKYVEGEDEDDE